jgi:Mg-chelatase subunit ChlD
MRRILRVSVLAVATLVVPALSAAQIADAPARIVLLVDSSSSMAPWVNEFRAGMTSFLDALPPDNNVVLISTGGQLRIRVKPTADRDQLRKAAEGFFSDSGANAFLDSLLEADQRFLKSTPAEWPVFVILTTDSGQTRGDPDIGSFNSFVKDFVKRGGNAYVVVIEGNDTGLTTDLAKNLADNTSGVFEVMSLAASLPDKMAEIAALIGRDYHPKRPY